MIKFCPFAAARCNTSSVAIIVTAIPVTGVCGSPALNVSTVGAVHGTPTFDLICSITVFAVGRGEDKAGAVAFCAYAENVVSKIAAMQGRIFMAPHRYLEGKSTSGTQEMWTRDETLSKVFRHYGEIAGYLEWHSVRNRCDTGDRVAEPLINRLKFSARVYHTEIGKLTASISQKFFSRLDHPATEPASLTAGIDREQAKIATARFLNLDVYARDHTRIRFEK